MAHNSSKHASLVESYCRRLSPSKDGVVDYYDTRLANLSLRATPPSKQHRDGLFTWRFGFRLHGKPGIVTIGRYPTWSADAALRQARELQVMVDKGVNPTEALRPRSEPAAAAETKAPIDTVAKMFARYLPELDAHSTRHRLNVVSYFTRFILPALGERDVHTLAKREIVDLLKEVKATSGPVSANRCGSALSAWLNYLVKDGVLDVSPATKLPKTEERPREQALTVPELTRVWRAAEALGGPSAWFVQLLIATATRRDEAAGLPRAEVDPTKQEWLLPANRNKSKRDFLIPLSSLAQAVLNACPNAGPFFFSRTGERPISGIGHIKESLDAELAKQPGAPLPHWTFHDLRRSVRTALSALQVDPTIAEKVLNHAPSKLERTYDRYGYAPEKRQALQRWADHFTAALGGAPVAAPALEEAAE